MKFFDRLLTIVITATLTSALWIVFGGPLLNNSESIRDSSEPQPEAPAQPASLEEANEADDTPRTESTDESEETQAPAADQASASELLIPVAGIKAGDLTDSFLERRGENGGRLHEAIDIMAPKGTAVVAAAAGTIAQLHVSPAGGNTIYLRSSDKETIHFYAHLDSYASGLREGQPIARGQLIGSVGSTGNASEDAPHLHFAILKTTADAEWWEPANAVNPFPQLTGAQ
jgi:murein DD-endopeptidase MepM/ murein hydrolase activator NlpD